MPSTNAADIDVGLAGRSALKAKLVPRWSWQAWLAIGTALTGAAAVLLHLVGNAVHRGYLSQWGIESGAFPKTAEWLTTQGYYGIWNALGAAFLGLWANWYWVVLVCVGILLYIIVLLMPWNPFDGAWARVWLGKCPKWVVRTLGILAGGAMATFLLMYLSLALFLIIGFPASLGRSIGEEIALNEAEDFVKGCAVSRRACVRLFRDGQLVGEGYLLESSPTHIAYMDIALRRARVVLRGDLELQSTRLPAAR